MGATERKMVVEALLYRELGIVAGPENAACVVEECMDQHCWFMLRRKQENCPTFSTHGARFATFMRI